jgi:hypothetical protein
VNRFPGLQENDRFTLSEAGQKPNGFRQLFTGECGFDFQDHFRGTKISIAEGTAPPAPDTVPAVLQTFHRRAADH